MDIPSISDNTEGNSRKVVLQSVQKRRGLVAEKTHSWKKIVSRTYEVVELGIKK